MKKLKPSVVAIVAILGTLTTVLAYSLAILGIISIFK